MKHFLALLFLLIAPLAHAQTLPGAPFTCQTVCSYAIPEPSTAPISLPPAPFTCQGSLAAPATVFSTPALPGVALAPSVVCSAPSTPAALPATPYACQQVCSAPVGPTGPPAGSPVVTAVSFPPAGPTTMDELVGHLTVSGLPLTALTIVSGNTAGYFAVYPATQNLRTSETGPIPPTGTYNLTITGMNAAGTGAPATINVVVP